MFEAELSYSCMQWGCGTGKQPQFPVHVVVYRRWVTISGPRSGTLYEGVDTGQDVDPCLGVGNSSKSRDAHLRTYEEGEENKPRYQTFFADELQWVSSMLREHARSSSGHIKFLVCHTSTKDARLIAESFGGQSSLVRPSCQCKPDGARERHGHI